MNGDIDKLIKYLEKVFVFDGEKYPELVGASDETKFHFALRHSALHMAKVAGKVAAVSESVDHGGEVDLEELKKNVAKEFTNTLRLAALVGVSEADLIRALEEKYKVKII